MPILIILGAAAVAAASYLVPLIISCVVSGVVIVATFLVTRAYYKSEQESTTEESALRQEQAQRDNAVREEVSRIALETGIDIQALLRLSKQQQEELKNSIQEFMQNIEESDNTTKNLAIIANTIQDAVNDANLQTTDLYSQLEIMKNELTNVYQKLSDTEANLANKEMELQETIDKLTELSEKISGDEVLNNLEHLQQEYAALYAEDQSSVIDNTEIISLKDKNINLNSTIESLNGTIEILERKLHNSTQREKLQIQEIQKLIADNKRLAATIESLTESIEVQNQKTTQFTQNTANQFRLFS